MNQRIERILFKLAEQHAPHLVQPGWKNQPDHLRRLARSLADYDVLVLMANIPTHLLPQWEYEVEKWLKLYADFYYLLGQTLFPNYAAIKSAILADDNQPPVAVVEARVSPIVEGIAGYLVPFVASRQAYTRVDEAELRVLMDAVFERLSLQDLSRPIYNTLVKDAITYIRGLLASPLQHIALTDFDRKLFNEVKKPQTMPPRPTMKIDPPAQVAPEEKTEFTLEQLTDEPPATPTERLFIHPVNINNGRKPPVPEPPRRKDSGKK